MAFKTLLNEVELLTQHPMVGLAITDSTGPVPGYLFGEINAITYVENGIYCKALVNFLISRLKSDTPIVCIKVLKLLSYLVKNAHSSLLDEVKLHEVTLKEARSFNGPADDVYGNSFYQTIRKMAKELLDDIFAENKEMGEKVPYADQTVLTGYGSEATSKKMSGFGYSAKSEKSVSDVVSDSFSSFVEKLFPSPDKEVQPSEMSHLSESLPKYKPLVIERTLSIDESIAAVESLKSVSIPVQKTQRKVKARRPGRAGGGWESSSDEENSSESPPPVVESSKESTVSTDSVESSKLFVQCASDISDECKIVEEFTVNEPLSELEYSNILSVCNRCSSLNCDEVLTFALQKLSATEELIQLRALIFIEYLLFHDIITLDALMKIVLPHLQMFIEDETKNMKPSVKVKAMKICKSIEILNKKCQQKVSSVEQMKCAS